MLSNNQRSFPKNEVCEPITVGAPRLTNGGGRGEVPTAEGSKRCGVWGREGMFPFPVRAVLPVCANWVISVQLA